MSRSINDIQQEILTAVNQANELQALEVLTTNEQTTVANLTSSSKVAIWRLKVWIVAFAIWVHEQLWKVFKADIEERIRSSRIHTRYWYRQKALDFRFGQDLIPETDQYSDEGLTAAEILESKIIRHAAVVRVVVNGFGALRIKLAKEENNLRVPLNQVELTAVNSYFNEHIADAGTIIFPVSSEPDDLKLNINIYYDPLILDATGSRLDGEDDEPVQKAVKLFLEQQEFNGDFIETELETALKAVDGVKIPVIKQAWSKFGNYEFTTENIPNVGLIDEIRRTEAGYMTIAEEDLNINFIPRADE